VAAPAPQPAPARQANPNKAFEPPTGWVPPGQATPVNPPTATAPVATPPPPPVQTAVVAPPPPLAAAPASQAAPGRSANPNKAFEPPPEAARVAPAVAAPAPSEPVAPPASKQAPTATVYFSSQSAEITDGTKAELGRVAKASKGVRQIMLNSYAGGGDPDDGRKVALARALAVRAYLIDLGVKSKIEIGTFAYLPGNSAGEYVD